MKVIITVVFLLFSNFVSAAWWTEKRLSTPLKVSAFNEVSSTYMERPTFVTLRKMGSYDALFIDYTPYGKKELGTGVLIAQKMAEEALAYITKYKQWNEQAKANGDAFEKDIGKTSSAAGMAVLFSFYSGNAKEHYLMISGCGLGMCTKNNPIFIDEANVSELEGLLTKFKNGELMLEDVSQKYN